MTRRAARRDDPSERPGLVELASAQTLTPAELPHASAPPTADDALAFPDLGGAEDRRMEELLAARLFPRRAAPQRIGRYTLLDRLGQGGMGVVYAAYDPELDRRVAIKLLLESLAGPAAQRLQREAQAMARVAHPNVVAVIDIGVHEGRSYVVMEHLRGQSLDRWQRRSPHWREVLRVYVQAGRGLAAAHRAGVIHRDFKPHNAMLIEGGVDDGRVKVLDFGLARSDLEEASREAVTGAAPGSFELSLTRTGALLGTPAYMAPEQLAGSPAGARSDQFSFAVSLYEALYGRLPFADDSLASLTRAVLAGAVRPPPTGSQVPRWVRRVVLRALSRDPDARFASMSELCDALSRDPGARRRAIGLTAALSAAVGAGGWGLAQMTEETGTSCEGSAFSLAEVWGPERAAEVDRAFAATGLPYAADAAGRVRAIVDEYAAAWSSQRRGACEAHRRGEQSAALLDLGMACLDRRRAWLSTLVGLFAAADAAVVERAVEAARGLPPLAGCADAAALRSDAPEEPALAGAVEAARGRLAEIGAQLAAGRSALAAAAAEEVLQRVEPLGNLPVIAEAALILGAAHLELGRGEEAERALTRAAQAGIAGRADRTAAEAVIRRLFARGVLLARPEVSGDAELAEAYAARFPDEGALQWLASMNQGGVAHRRGDAARAGGLYRRALAVERGPSPIDRARTRVNLGLLAYDARDFEAALAEYRAAIGEASEALGERHPLVAQLVVYEAIALEGLGRFGPARERFEAAIAGMSAGADGAQHAVWPQIYLARLDARLGRREAAQEHARRAMRAASEPLAAINAEIALADALVDAPEQALAHYAAALGRCEATQGESGAVTASILEWIAEGMLRHGRAAEALPLARRALALAEAQGGADAAAAASIRRVLADVLLARGEAGEALAAARGAVTALERSPGDHAVERWRAQRSLGLASLAIGEGDGAAAALREAEGIARGRLAPDDPELVALQEALARGGSAER